MTNFIDYHPAKIHAHFDKSQKNLPIYLMNEAPGPSEAKSGIPLFGQQGGNLYRTLKKNNFDWAQTNFSWPVKGRDDYPKVNKDLENRFIAKNLFLKERAKNIVCTNSFDQWPRPINNLESFIAPLDADILSGKNLKRIKNELTESKPKILLLCGKCSYLACAGEHIKNPAEIEGEKLEGVIRTKIEARLEYQFEMIYYLGHTRRWSMSGDKIDKALITVRNFVDN